MAELLSSPIDANGNSFKNTTLVHMIIDMGVKEMQALSELQKKV